MASSFDCVILVGLAAYDPDLMLVGGNPFQIVCVEESLSGRVVEHCGM